MSVEAPRSLARAQTILLLCASVAALGGVAALSLHNLTGPFCPYDRPNGFSLPILLGLYMDHLGVEALLAATLTFAMAAGLRDRKAPLSRLGALGLEAAAWLVLGGLGLRLSCVIRHGLPGASQARTLARFFEAAATAVVAIIMGRGLGLRRLLLSPRWSWLFTALISSALPLVMTMLSGGNGEHISFWLRLSIYPLCFASCWAVWERGREASLGGSHAALLGIIIYLPTSFFMLHEEYLGDPVLGDLKSAYILTLMAAGLNAGGLVVAAGLRLWRGAGQRMVLLNILVGLVLLTAATFPTIVLPWEYEPTGLINRLGINSSQAMVGALLIMLTRATIMLRRWDPLGGPQRGMCLVWLLMVVGFLTSSVVRDWIWSYEVWVEKEQWATDVRFRAQVAASWAPLSFISLLTMVPSVVRAVRARWTSADAPKS